MLKRVLLTTLLVFLAQNISPQVISSEQYNRRPDVYHLDYLDKVGHPYKIESEKADSNVTLIGRWTDGNFYAVFVVGNYAYVAASSDRLRIINVSNPHRLSKQDFLIPMVLLTEYMYQTI